eukprot:396323_1
MEEAVQFATEIAIGIANDAEYSILCTVDECNMPRARPVRVFQSNIDLKLRNIDRICFNTRYKARKTKQLLNNSEVVLMFCIYGRHEYVLFKGNAHPLSRQKACKYWNQSRDQIWFAKGPNGGQYTVFEVNITSIEILSPKLLKYFRGSNVTWPECNETSKPFIMNKHNTTDKWIISHPNLYSKL